jgi:sugar lactone lactonase YvrE
VSIHRIRVALPAVLVTAVLAVPAGVAGASPAAAPVQSADGRGAFPTTIPLPDGFAPEGIAIGSGGRPHAWFGSLVDGSIYRANLATGRGKIVSEGPGTPSVGLKIDRRGRLFVAGGPAGGARVVDASSGRILAGYTLAAGASFVNDVVLTPDAAWFTDSFNPVLYKVPLDRHGRLPEQAQVETLPLTGDLVFGEGFNVNGIERTPDGTGLIVDQSNTGLLFRVDPATGATTTIDLGGARLPAGDGILLSGTTLFVVQNQLNQVAVVELNPTGTSGTVGTPITDPRFDTPTTVAEHRGRLYLPNARFAVEPTPTTNYDAVAVPKP